MLLSYAPGMTINIEFDVTSFSHSLPDNTGNVLPEGEQVSVDPFGTAFDIYIDAPMLEIDETSDLYKSGKVTKDPSKPGRFIYHVDASRDVERTFGTLKANVDSKTTANQIGERKSIPFKTKSIVSAGDIVISSDESKVVFYQKRFRVQNSSIAGTLQYRKDGQVRNIPAGSFVPFEMESTYNRIGTVAVSDGGQFELRLRSEYRYDWMTDRVNFQYVEDGVTYIKTFTNLNTLNDFSGPIILDPLQ